MNINRTLTKDFILKRVDQVSIYSVYLGIPETDICNAIKNNTLIESAFRFDDNFPSLGFKYSIDGKLKARDFSGYFWGDCFDAVGFQLRINSNNKEGFYIILKDIAARFKLRDEKSNLIVSPVDVKEIRAKKDKKIFEFAYRNWNAKDLDYWNPIINVDNVPEYLVSNYIYPIENLYIDRYINDRPKYYYKPDDPAYDYYLGTDSSNFSHHKVYLPNRRYPFTKFLANTNAFQNIQTLNDRWDVLLLTKSYKDVVAIKSFLPDNLIYEVIAPPAENYVFAQHMIDWFADRTNLALPNGKPAIFSLYDMDYAGLANSGNLKRQFGIERLMFGTGAKGSRKMYDGKDFTDNTRLIGKYRMQDIVDEFTQTLLNILE